MNHPAMKLTGLGRSLDFKYPGNWDIFFLTLAVTIFGIGFQLIWGPGRIQSVLWGLAAGLSIFLIGFFYIARIIRGTN